MRPLRAVALGFSLLPAWAWACPSCAGRDGGGPLRLVLVGGMIAAPFLLAAVVVLLLRKHVVGAEPPRAPPGPAEGAP